MKTEVAVNGEMVSEEELAKADPVQKKLHAVALEINEVLDKHEVHLAGGVLVDFNDMDKQKVSVAFVRFPNLETAPFTAKEIEIFLASNCQLMLQVFGESLVFKAEQVVKRIKEREASVPVINHPGGARA